MSQNKHGPAVTIRFNGRNYRRYPASPRRDIRVYYGATGGRRLHRAIWEHHNGPIPKGFHVHHIDENPLNNEIENLALMEASDHLREHWTDEKREWARDNIRLAQAAAPAWHRSPEGRAWHSENAKKCAANLQPFKQRCVCCGEEFDALKKTAMLCSNKCRAKHRRDSGADHVEFTCIRCGVAYFRNKYSANAGYCSKTCSARSRTTYKK